MGRFAIAAKHHQTIAEIYEGEGADLDKAMQHYERAADFFKGEESNSSANKCMLKVLKGSHVELEKNYNDRFLLAKSEKCAKFWLYYFFLYHVNF